MNYKNLVAVQMELTNQCTLGCAECARRFMTRPIGDMDLDLAKKIATDAKNYKSDIGFNLNGLGEPLLYKELPRFIQHLKDIGPMRLDLFSSLAVSRSAVNNVIDVLSNYNNDVLFAITKHMYDWDGELQKANINFDENFKNVVNDLSNNKKIAIHINMVLTKYHTDEVIADFFNYYRQFLPHNNVHVTEKLNTWFYLVDHQAWKHGADVGGKNFFICDFPFTVLHVGWNGDVIICCLDDVCADCNLGPFTNFKDVWEGDKLHQIRELFNNGFNKDKTQIIQPCNKCYRTEWLWR